jgi:hypothetical protein
VRGGEREGGGGGGGGGGDSDLSWDGLEKVELWRTSETVEVENNCKTSQACTNKADCFRRTRSKTITIELPVQLIHMKIYRYT